MMFGRIYAWCLNKLAKRLGLKVGMDYRDWVRSSSNRQLMVNQWKAEAQDREDAKQWDDERLAKEIKQYLMGKSKTWNQRKLLRSLGRRINSFVCDIMLAHQDSPKFMKVNKDEYESCFSRACNLFDEKPPAELLPLIKAHVFAEDRCNSTAALHVLGQLSAIADPMFLIEVIEQGKHHDGLFEGMLASVKRGELSLETRQLLFKPVKEFIEKGKYNSASTELLEALDAEAAMTFYTSRHVLHREFKSLDAVLCFLNDRNIAAPHELLIQLTDELEDSSELGHVLQILGLHQDEGDRVLLLKFISDKSLKISTREGAVEGLAISYGLNGLDQEIYRLMEDLEYEAWPEEMKQFSAVVSLDAEVQNGGFSQYYTNPTAETWPVALRALKEMESIDLLAIFEESLNRFGEVKLSTDWDERGKQMDPYFGKNPRLLDDLDDRWYDSDESAETIFWLYAIKHPEKYTDIRKWAAALAPEES